MVESVLTKSVEIASCTGHTFTQYCILYRQPISHVPVHAGTLFLTGSYCPAQANNSLSYTRQYYNMQNAWSNTGLTTVQRRAVFVVEH